MISLLLFFLSFKVGFDGSRHVIPTCIHDVSCVCFNVEFQYGKSRNVKKILKTFKFIDPLLTAPRKSQVPTAGLW
jgi:hypothetical protein